jgi:adenylate kinase
MSASAEQIRGPRVVLLGKQGAGKGTQAARIAAHFDVLHLSTGELFRSAAKQGSPFGLEARAFMDRGELVPDAVVIGVVEELLIDGGLAAAGFVLDGFPRTLPQSVELERILVDKPLDVAVNLDVSTDIVLDRIAGRRVCENCGATYHVNAPPAVNWTCDLCGHHVVQREDDTDEAVIRRLEIYEQETVPILDFYRQQSRLLRVDGEGESDDVFKRLIDAVGTHFHP